MTAIPPWVHEVKGMPANNGRESKAQGYGKKRVVLFSR